MTLDCVLQELQKDSFSDEQKIELYKKAFNIIEDKYSQAKKEKLVNKFEIFMNSMGNFNEFLFSLFGVYLCSKKKKKTTDEEKIDFIIKSNSIKENKEIEVVSLSSETENELSDTIKENQRLHEEIKKLQTENIYLNDDNKKIQKNNLKEKGKFLQKILGYIGPEPDVKTESKIYDAICAQLEDVEIEIYWEAKHFEESVLFDVYKTDIQQDREVRLPALVSGTVVLEKGMIYRLEEK